ncbi:hypothetical protein ACFQT2_17830 [Pseudoroseomonas aestuarii]
MMGYTADGQLDPAKLAARDEKLGIDTAAKRRARAEIPVPEVAPGANAWEGGQTPQLRLEQVPVRKP